MLLTNLLRRKEKKNMAKKEKVGMTKVVVLKQIFTEIVPKKNSVRFDESKPVAGKLNPLQNIYISKAAMEEAGLSGTPSRVIVTLQVEA
jgi:hypothetical protein